MEKEVTFTAYKQDQATAYLSGRGQDNENLIRVITSTHQKNGGELGTLLDLGCGPGNSTRPLAKYFEKALGRDTSEAMIGVAREMEGRGEGGTRTGGQIDFKVQGAEDTLKELAEKGEQVDVITAGMAAHWFDIPKFWSLVPGALRKGGLVALWQYPGLLCFHPSTPNAKQANAVVNRLIGHDTVAFEKPGNKLCREAYHTFPKPWDQDPPVDGFREGDFKRLEWDRNGELSEGEHFFLGEKTMSMDEVYDSLVTSSMITRWREGNKGLAFTKDDVAIKAIEEIERLIGKEEAVVGRDVVLLLFKIS